MARPAPADRRTSEFGMQSGTAEDPPVFMVSSCAHVFRVKEKSLRVVFWVFPAGKVAVFFRGPVNRKTGGRALSGPEGSAHRERARVV